MSTSIRDLSPNRLWNNFEDLNQIPRPSKKEAMAVAFIRDFSEKLGLETTVDDIGNVLVRKPATKGMEGRKTVILQSHLDMVHQKNKDTDFDFDSEGIRSFIDGEWVKAKGTTLGADNGIGVATMMSILESQEIQHPNIECLFTVDEEAGMTGVRNFKKDILKGQILLNLDTEDDDEFSIGCAGGIDTNTLLEYEENVFEEQVLDVDILVRGLKGGHSGMEIHLGRANANKILARVLFEIKTEFHLNEIDGGSLRNAIPREAFAKVFVLEKYEPFFKIELQRIVEAIVKEYQSVESNLEIKLVFNGKTESFKCMGKVLQSNIIKALHICPNGVGRMNPNMDNIPETSSNLARVILRDGRFTTKSLQRSSIDEAKKDMASRVGTCFELIGCYVSYDGDYPGWMPKLDSEILNVMKNIYYERYDKHPKVSCTHGGLECGILGETYPDIDMISFGPTIKNPHSPDEKVNIKSVDRFFSFLLEILSKVPSAV
ncbi:aminoacyl-histidine dipeptidase [Ichthyobacterium seriolicida]|uniref:Cytosol non-specific dipeptidase n=1 Tax=Ichthyobacterium seriolicida TaxID=242600 RepID=A0A1J1DZP9_9FLAO|nr:aminoacyl-histidine dipeptidase [Ichthyobacterium seriolicida]BAV95377.1 aminoacyl-histidine dipeptidase [Ichthyobacterium seriolicida]